MSEENIKEEQSMKKYELSIRFLGNEIFAIGMASSSDSNKWILIGLVSMFSILTVLGAYGSSLLAFLQSLKALFG